MDEPVNTMDDEEMRTERRREGGHSGVEEGC